MLFQNADAAGLGVFQAARERTGVYVIGANADQNGLAPTVTLGSVVLYLPRAFLAVAREVKDGTFRPRVVLFDDRSGVVRLVLNPALQSRIPTRVRAQIDSVQAQILSGAFSATATR
jgi:basic membrane lipoprotein Med (substrate-binding protein (PBP1-ABC) superfamily)